MLEKSNVVSVFITSSGGALSRLVQLWQKHRRLLMTYRVFEDMFHFVGVDFNHYPFASLLQGN